MLLNKFKEAFRKFFQNSDPEQESSSKNASTKQDSQTYFLISQERAKVLQQGYYEEILALTDEELVAEYNQINKNRGIPKLGNLQGLYLMTMHKGFIERFEKSPFIIGDNYSMRLGGHIVYYEFMRNFDFLNNN